jgi:hypothetical protein
VIVRFLFALWFLLPNLFATGNAMWVNFVKGITKEPYQVWWAGLVGVLQLLAVVPVARSRRQCPGPPWLAFGLLSLLGCAAEEFTCYLVRTGIFKHMGKVPTPILFMVGTGLLWLCALGSYLIYVRFELKWHQALLLFAFSGFLLEAFPFQKLYRHIPLPILLGLFPPVVAWHYVLIGLFPYLLVRDRIESHPRTDHWIKWPLGLFFPLALPTVIVLTVLS